MSKLISGKEAFDAAFNGVSAEWRWANKDEDWRELEAETVFSIRELKGGDCEFRLKPRTITINGIELNQCYSVAIDYTRNEVKVEFKNRNDAEALHDVISKLYGFK